MIENEIPPPFLGVAWDGTGLGDDGTIWGGEFFVVRDGSFDRVAHLRQFMLPGGDAAAHEPRRSAMGLLYALEGESAFSLSGVVPLETFSETERAALLRMLARRLNSPRTSSAGRLFDAVSALLGIRQRTTFEGQAAMELEWGADDSGTDCYPIVLNTSTNPIVVDWASMIEAILADVRAGISRAAIAGAFHRSLAAAILQVARAMGLERVALTGGCFQNALLTRLTKESLAAAGFHVYVHQRIPPNDGGIAPGQIAAAAFMGLV